MYKTQCDAIKQLPPEQFKDVVIALWDYELDGQEPDGRDPVVTAMFLMAKPLIDKRLQNCENGKKGGRPKTETKPNETELKPNHNPTETQQNPTETEPNLKVKGKRLKGNKIKEYIYPVFDDIVSYLNQKAGTSFRSTSKDTRSHINARLSEGYTVDDFYTVIDKKVAEWGGTDMAKYLRPSTLFGSKFESYLNQQTGKKTTSNRFDNFEGRKYDFDDLERQLLAVQGGNT